MPWRDTARNDNFRVQRFIARNTINPAITHGISQVVGSVIDFILDQEQPHNKGGKPPNATKNDQNSHELQGDPGIVSFPHEITSGNVFCLTKAGEKKIDSLEKSQETAKT